MKKHIPNLITAGNIFSGCCATLIAFKAPEQLHLAAFFIMAAAVFDFFDGFAARLLNAYSDMGKELDSLADMISFGFAPGAIVFTLLLKATGTENIQDLETGELIICLSAFFITVLSAFRLAKFNIDTRQTSSFIGLPTPANALFFISFPLILHYTPDSFMVEVISNQWFLIAISVFMSLMLISELPMFSFKFKNYSLKDNKIRYTFLVFIIISSIALKFSAIPFIIAAYFIFSLINNIGTAKAQ